MRDVGVQVPGIAIAAMRPLSQNEQVLLPTTNTVHVEITSNQEPWARRRSWNCLDAADPFDAMQGVNQDLEILVETPSSKRRVAA